jgi:hypothetical protein
MNLSKGCSSYKIVGTWAFRVLRVFDPTSGADWIVEPSDEARLRAGFVAGSYQRFERYKEYPFLDGVDLPPLRLPNGEQQLNAAAIGNGFRNSAADASRMRRPRLR